MHIRIPNSPRRRLAAVSAVLALFAGCDGSDVSSARIPTVPAKGKVVTADGKPLPGGIITLEPLPNGGSTNQAAGEVKPDGTFELRSSSDKEGAMPGKYRVKIETADGAKTLTKSGKEPEVEVKDGQELEVKLPG